MEEIRISAIIEIAGKPEKHVKETIKKMIDILKNNKKIKVIKEEIAPPKKNEFEPSPGRKAEIFSSFADLEIDFPDFDEVMQFIYNFMPSSIEILEPEKIKINQKDLENSLNDLIATLHNQAKVAIEYQALKKFVESNKNLKTS